MRIRLVQWRLMGDGERLLCPSRPAVRVERPGPYTVVRIVQGDPDAPLRRGLCVGNGVARRQPQGFRRRAIPRSHGGGARPSGILYVDGLLAEA